MSVTVDDQPLAADKLGLTTIGQVLNHLSRANRLIVHVLIDGQEPDLERLPAVRQSPLNGHTIFIETADPRKIAIEILTQVEQVLLDADPLKTDAIDLLGQGLHVKALEKLGGCFAAWQQGQESISKIGQLLRLDLSRVSVGEHTLTQVLESFAGQLQEIKTALENRDFVLLGDILAYESADVTQRWRDALHALRHTIQNLK